MATSFDPDKIYKIGVHPQYDECVHKVCADKYRGCECGCKIYLKKKRYLFLICSLTFERIIVSIVLTIFFKIIAIRLRVFKKKMQLRDL